jgi:hypothetical protein
MWPCPGNLGRGIAVKPREFTGRLLWPWQNEHLSVTLRSVKTVKETQWNHIHWLLPLSDWLDTLIGPGGLLLVVFHHLNSQFQFYWWGWRNVTKIWMWENIFSITYWALLEMLLVRSCYWPALLQYCHLSKHKGSLLDMLDMKFWYML